MRYDPEENTAGRRQFDIVLPPDVRAEILEPKRPAILRRPIYQPPTADRTGLLKWVGAFAVVVILLIGTITNNIQRKPPATSQPDPVLQHSREILQQSTPAPVQQPISQPPLQQPISQPPRLVWEWVRSEAYGPVWVQCYAGCTPARGGLIVRDPAPHAQLVRSPVPRAELIRLPQ
jgi:hypothetical protein